MGGRSPLVAALVQAVLDQHAKRARLIEAEAGMFGVLTGVVDVGDPGPDGAAEERKMPHLKVIRGGRRP